MIIIAIIFIIRAFNISAMTSRFNQFLIRITMRRNRLTKDILIGIFEEIVFEFLAFGAILA